MIHPLKISIQPFSPLIELLENVYFLPVLQFNIPVAQKWLSFLHVLILIFQFPTYVPSLGNPSELHNVFPFQWHVTDV